MTAIDRLMSQAETRMSWAEERGDLDSWIKHYLIWLELVPLKIRQGGIMRLANTIHQEESDETTSNDLPLFHPAVG